MKESLELIKELREKTGAGVMDCKSALKRTGSLEEAIIYLESQDKGFKYAKKEAKEGMVAIHAGETKMSIIEVNCETDFAARSKEFSQCVLQLVQLVQKVDIASDKEAQKLISQAISVIGENIRIRRVETIEGGDMYGAYVHTGGQVGAVVALKIVTKIDFETEIGKNIAMQVVALSPKYLTVKEMIKETSSLVGEKEENDSVLYNQKYLKDPTKTVGEYLKENGVEVIRFVRYQVSKN
ncbi:MAG: translation elongation factor Ts [Deltaproteobacteria bacterium]|nr:MAG: translation elongation factor Ts [Deltaproteobacteria bacterium]